MSADPITLAASATRSPDGAKGAPPLAFAFAKRHGVFVQQIENGIAQAVYRDDASPSSIAEVARYLGVRLQLSRVNAETFEQMLRTRYEGGNTAMQMVGGFEDDTDLAHLAQDLPEPSDLLESDDHA